MKNKGFTLIELLATITILTVILLITFVSVGSVIKNSKSSLHDNQISQLEKAAEYYNSEEELKNSDSCINVSDLVDKGYIKQDDVKDPKTGKTIDGSVKIKYNGKKYSYEYDEKLCTYSFIELVSDADNDGKLSIGDEYTFKVNDTDTFHFYVLSIEEESVNLIMNSNICNDGTTNYTSEKNYCNYVWHWQIQEYDEDDNNYGPDIAMTNLYNGTKGWTNVPDMIMDYEDENNKTDDTKGYISIMTDKTTKVTTITGKQNKTSTSQTFGNLEKPLKARLPREDEVSSTEAGCGVFINTNEFGGTCAAWLVENLYYDPDFNSWCTECVSKYLLNENNGIEDIWGYWLLSSTPGYSDSAKFVDYAGFVNYSPVTSDPEGLGVRPVITISKNDFEKVN